MTTLVLVLLCVALVVFEWWRSRAMRKWMRDRDRSGEGGDGHLEPVAVPSAPLAPVVLAAEASIDEPQQEASMPQHDLIPLDETGVIDPESLHLFWREGIIPRVHVTNVRGRTVRAISKQDLARVTTSANWRGVVGMRCRRRILHDYVKPRLTSRRLHKKPCLWCGRNLSGHGFTNHLMNCVKRHGLTAVEALDQIMRSDAWGDHAGRNAVLEALARSEQTQTQSNGHSLPVERVSMIQRT